MALRAESYVFSASVSQAFEMPRMQTFKGAIEWDPQS